MGINKMFKEVIDICVCEFNKEDNRKKIEDNILEPVIEYILDKIKPYILITSIFLITIILLILCILYISILPKTNNTG